MLLTELGPDVLCAILSQLDTCQDLCRLGRVCQRLHEAVRGCDAAWQRLHEATYPAAQHAPGGSSASAPSHRPACYRELFKERWVRDAKEQRLQQKVQRMRLQSDSAQLERELRELAGRLHAERRQQQHLAGEVQRLHRAQAASRATDAMQWQLSAVKLYHNEVVAQAAPMRLDARLATLQQQQRVCALELKTLQAGIASRRQRLAATKRRLAALEG